MSNSLISFTAVKTHADNKDLKQDADGYYYVTLGAFNCFNSSGSFYLKDGVEDLVKNKSYNLARRLEKSQLYGEMQHPQFQPGMSKSDFFIRNLKIDMDHISHHIKSIEFKEIDTPSGVPGKGKVLKVMGWVKPAGEKGNLLKQALENKEQNVAFSIRCLTDDSVVHGTEFRKVVQIITWDWVVEPGISVATTWNTLATEERLILESSDDLRISLEDLTLDSSFLKEAGLKVESQEQSMMLKEITDRVRTFSNPNDFINQW